MNTLPKLDADAAGRAAVELATRADAAMEFRRRLYGTGFVPLPIQTQGKACYLESWSQEYEREIPRAVSEPFDPASASTGILCNGLRAIDVDVDDAELADAAVEIVTRRLGGAPIRDRDGSPRRLLLYRAAEGSPAKKSVGDPGRMVEVLGHGNQFVADGLHTSGKPYSWGFRPGADIALAGLESVTEDQIDGALTEIGVLIGKPYALKTNQELQPTLIEGAEKAPPASTERRFDRLSTCLQNELIAVCFKALDNTKDDPRETHRDMCWAAKDAWNRGADQALELCREWAQRGARYDGDKSERDMDGYFAGFKPGGRGAGSFIKAAREAGAGPAIDAIFARGAFESIDDVGATTEKSNDDYRPRYRLVNDILPDETEHLFDGILRQRAIGVLYSAPYIGKTVFTVGLACSIAHGLPYMGRDCAKGAVFIVELEGSELIADNIRAWHKHRNLEIPSNIGIYDEYISILSDPDLKAMSEDIRHFHRQNESCDLIVLDTLSQATAGEDENAQATMSLAIKNMALLGREVGSAVLILHHENAEGKARGSSTIPANIDTVVRLIASSDGTIQVSCQKFKGGKRPPPDTFRIAEVMLRKDRKGRDVGGGVAVHVPVAEAIASRLQASRTPAENSVLNILRQVRDGTMHKDEIKRLFRADYALTSGNPKTADTARRRAIKALIDARLIVEIGDNFALMSDSARAAQVFDAIESNDIALPPSIKQARILN